MPSSPWFRPGCVGQIKTSNGRWASRHRLIARARERQTGRPRSIGRKVRTGIAEETSKHSGSLRSGTTGSLTETCRNASAFPTQLPRYVRRRRRCPADRRVRLRPATASGLNHCRRPSRLSYAGTAIRLGRSRPPPVPGAAPYSATGATLRSRAARRDRSITLGDDGHRTPATDRSQPFVASSPRLPRHPPDVAGHFGPLLRRKVLSLGAPTCPSSFVCWEDRRVAPSKFRRIGTQVATPSGCRILGYCSQTTWSWGAIPARARAAVQMIGTLAGSPSPMPAGTIDRDIGSSLGHQGAEPARAQHITGRPGPGTRPGQGVGHPS
jgi:hypothetical protein